MKWIAAFSSFFNALGFKFICNRTVSIPFCSSSSSSSSSSSASDSFSTMALYKSIYLHTYLLSSSSSSSSITKITFSLYINLCDRNQQTHTQKRTVKILSL